MSLRTDCVTAGTSQTDIGDEPAVTRLKHDGYTSGELHSIYSLHNGGGQGLGLGVKHIDAVIYLFPSLNIAHIRVLTMLKMPTWLLVRS